MLSELHILFVGLPILGLLWVIVLMLQQAIDLAGTQHSWDQQPCRRGVLCPGLSSAYWWYITGIITHSSLLSFTFDQYLPSSITPLQFPRVLGSNQDNVEITRSNPGELSFPKRHVRYDLFGNAKCWNTKYSQTYPTKSQKKKHC